MQINYNLYPPKPLESPPIPPYITLTMTVNVIGSTGFREVLGY